MARKNLRTFVVSIPVLGYCVRLVSNLVRLPKLHDQFVQTRAEINKQLSKNNSELASQLSKLSDSVGSLQLAHDNLQGQFSLFETARNSKPNKIGSNDSDTAELFADDHIMDNFYASFEDRFRGTESVISKRLEEYLPYFSDSKINFKKVKVLDIGSGRGEFLQLLKKSGISAVGLDINHDMVERSMKKSLEAVQGEALAFLQEANTQTYGAITGFHLVEHIPFNALYRIFMAAHRALVRDGFVIFETPNPENLIVGSSTFYTDPSHLNPLPPVLLAFALETCGFKNVEIKRLHPDKNKKPEGLDPTVSDLLFGPRDYAVIGYK